MNKFITQLQESVAVERQRLLEHPMYSSLTDIASVKKFTETHVFAVWDFMSLLKSLQLGLTSVNLPWKPVGSPDTRYLINEIVLGEESDIDEAGNRTSHFELYLKAMNQLGSDTTVINTFISQLPADTAILQYIKESALPEHVKLFLDFTFQIALNAPIHVKAAVFTFGREDLIPNMFLRILEKLYSESPDKIAVLKYYIERHIEVDGEHHSHLGMAMVAQLCGEDETKWKEATAASAEALKVRYKLWDHILTETVR